MRAKTTGRRGTAKRRAHRPRRPRAGAAMETGFVELLAERIAHPETSPSLSGGDVDADWQRAMSDGEEAVGGSVPTPDQDVVDEIGRALGVEQPADGEVYTSAEILRQRDRDYWRLEREAEEDERA